MQHWLRYILRCCAIFLLAVFLLLSLFRYRYSGAITELSHTQIVNTTSDLINDAIDQQIETGNIQYDRIVYFEKDLDGRITALKMNMSEVNRLKTDILNRINDEILAIDSTELGVPVGSLIFPELFSGRGPAIPVQVLAIRNSDASFSSHFTQAGINQTLQQLTMDVVVDISVLVLGKTHSLQVKSQVVVAETIIVGQVPNTYLQTGDTYGSGKENQ